MTTSDAALTPDAPAAPPDPKGRLLLQHRSVGLIALGALAWLAGGALLIADADMLAAGRWYTPTLLAAAHLIGLGFLTTVIVGAVQHLAPNMSSRRLVGGRAVGVTLWGGAVILAVGLATGQAALEGIGGTVLSVGVVWLVVGVALMWRGRRGSWPEPLAGLALSTLWLAGVLVLGLVGSPPATATASTSTAGASSARTSPWPPSAGPAGSSSEWAPAWGRWCSSPRRSA